MSLPICDAHLHLIPCLGNNDELPMYESEYKACTCAHDIDEFSLQEKKVIELNIDSNSKIYQSFGMHPQNPLIENHTFLESLLEEKRLSAIGEMGFDLYTEEFKSNIQMQQKAWDIQLDLALKYDKPIIVHMRKAGEKVFLYSEKLKKLPYVVFHSFAGNIIEAQAILHHDINAIFSFGKSLLNGNKKSLSCILGLDYNRMLLETDAPFQTLKGEHFTPSSDIKKIYDKVFELRELKSEEDKYSFCDTLSKNFVAVFDNQ